MDGLRTGRIVDFVLPEDEQDYRLGKPDETDPFVPRWHKGDHVPAIVVGVNDAYTGNINLQGFHNVPMMLFVEQVPYSGTMEPGTWHWLERA